MKISTKGSYALEIITEIALCTRDEKPQSLKSIAKTRNLSEKYLERIARLLKQEGLVRSVRGAHGGYMLGRPAGEITVKDILISVEGELAPVECLTKETDCGIPCESCPTRSTWGSIWQIMLDAAQSVTLEEVISETKRIEKEKM